MNSIGKVSRWPAAGFLGLAILFSAELSSVAQQPNIPGDPGAPPANPDTSAARLSDVQGDVAISQGNQLLAEPALMNTPLFAGTMIVTKEDGRAEIQFDDGSVARISPNSSLKIAVLGRQGGTANAEVVLESGLGYFELQGNTDGAHMIARFGDSSVSASGFTVLRIDVDNPPGEVAVFSGNAHMERGNSLSLDLHAGESVALNSGDPNQYNLAETIEPNSWDAWNADRDQELTSAQADRTAASGSQPNSSNPAWSDLDANGDWYNVPGQGYVWSPNEAAQGNWDPYGCGNWVWNPQFGYSWVSCEPWGYLPYTSGNWDFYDGLGWGWSPGYGYPWWTTGGWACNVGRGPARYQPPHRPHGGPIHSPVQPGRRGGYEPNPVIAVNRIPRNPAGSSVRAVGGPITVAGSTLTPLRPLSPRPVYNHTTSSGMIQTFPGSGTRVYGYAGQNGYGSPGSVARPGTWTMPASPGGYHPMPGNPYSGGGAHSYSPPRVNSGGGGRPSGGGGGSPHVSSGGGGGHVSSGGGGGGGGHASSGGGGHH